MKKCGHSFKSCRRSQFKQYCQNLMRKEKSYWNLKQSKKQEFDSYEIDQFQSISSSGRTYPLKITNGRVRILNRSIQNYSSIEDNTFLKERGMLGRYTTSVTPYYYYYNPLIILLCPSSPHIVIIVPHRSPLLLLLCHYIIIVMSALIIL